MMPPDKFEREMRTFCEPILWVLASASLAFAIVPVLVGAISPAALLGITATIPITCTAMASYAIRKRRRCRADEIAEADAAHRVRFHKSGEAAGAWINCPLIDGPMVRRP